MQTATACYLMTSKGTLMPAQFAGYDDSRGYRLARLLSPQGKEYTCNPASVLDEQTGYTLLLSKRGEQLIERGYDIALRSSGALRVFNPARHGASGGYLLRAQGGKLSCTCPSALSSPFGLCKHVLGCVSLCFAKAAQCDNLGKARHAATWRGIAERLLSPSEAQQPGPPDPPAPVPSYVPDDYQGQDCSYCGLPACQYNGDGDLVCRSCSRK